MFNADVEGSGDTALRFMETVIEFNGSNYSLLYTGERNAFEENIDIARHMPASASAYGIVIS